MYVFDGFPRSAVPVVTASRPRSRATRIPVGRAYNEKRSPHETQARRTIEAIRNEPQRFIVMSSDPESSSQAAVKRILVAVDAGESSLRTVQYVRNMPLAQARIRLVSVAENPRNIAPLGSLTNAALHSARTQIAAAARRSLEKAASVFADSGIEVQSDVIELSGHGGYAGNALVDAAAEWRAELLVLGARQHHGLLRWIEGTVSRFATAHAPCPILVVPESYAFDTAVPRPLRILCCVDGSETSLDAMRFGLRFATSATRVRAIYVIDQAVRLTDLFPIRALQSAFEQEGESALDNAASILAELSTRAEVDLVRTGTTSDDVPHTIVREAQRWGADLVVVGTHGRRGAVRWIVGSVAARTARIAATPLLLARPAVPTVP